MASTTSLDVTFDAGTTIVSGVVDSGLGAAAGLQAGDRVVSANGEPIERAADMRAILAELPADGTLTLAVERDGEHLQLPETSVNASLKRRLGDPAVIEAYKAYQQGNGFFQVEIEMRSINQARGFWQGPVASPGGKFNVKDSGSTTHADVLSQIEAVGWRLEHMNHVWVVTGSQSREKFMRAGQDVGMMGELVGIYLFRRVEQE